MKHKREKEIQLLCKKVLAVEPEFLDNSCSDHVQYCPFCGEDIYGGSSKMSDIGHNVDCAYLIAKSLSTNV